MDTAPTLTGATFVVTLRQIMEGEVPIRLVSHWPEGEWEFLHGASFYTHDQVEVPFADLLNVDPSLAAIADLPEDWLAKRNKVGDEWHRKWIYEGMPYQPLEERM